MRTLTLVLALSFFYSAVNAQIIDSAPSSAPNHRAVLGGEKNVPIDTSTSRPELIKRLEKPWKFVETFKAYWIGYTDDMYSIAAYKDNAIKPLTDLIDTSKK